LATKSKGVGRGGARSGAGRKPKATPPNAAVIAAAEALLAGKTVEELMELAVRFAAMNGHWDEVSKRGARYVAARARSSAVAGKGVKAQRQAAADALSQTSRFAPPPPPRQKSN